MLFTGASKPGPDFETTFPANRDDFTHIISPGFNSFPDGTSARLHSYRSDQVSSRALDTSRLTNILMGIANQISNGGENNRQRMHHAVRNFYEIPYFYETNFNLFKLLNIAIFVFGCCIRHLRLFSPGRCSEERCDYYADNR